MIDKDERQEKWFQTGLEQELKEIEGLPSDLNIYKPNNPFWQSLFRIGGIAKAGFITKDDALNRILLACQHMTLKEKEIAYQWNRAYQRAQARYLKT